MAALRQTGLRTSRLHSLIDNNGMLLERNDFLLFEYFSADGAADAFRQAGLGAGRLFPGDGDFGVSLGIDKVTAVTSAAKRTGIDGIAAFRAGRLHRFRRLIFMLAGVGKFHRIGK